MNRDWVRRNRWLVLGLVASAALVALIGYALTRPDDSAREDVSAYIGDVNRAQDAVGPDLARVDRAYRGFRSQRRPAKENTLELARAERAIRELHRNLRALDPPPDADRLHARIVHAVSLEAAFATEVTQMARVLPQVDRLHAPLPAAAERLRRELEAAQTVEAQEKALARYAGVLRRVADEAAGLPAPPVLAASLAAEAGRLRTSARVMDRLATAARERNAAEIAQLNRYLDEQAKADGATAAERDAILAYNRRLRAIAAARVAVARERDRLERELD